MNNQVLILVFSIFLLHSQAIQLPSYFTQCDENQPNLGDCIQNSANDALPRLLKGDKKIHVVRLHPLHVDNMFIDVNGGGLTINLTNCDIWGLETAKMVFNNWDKERKRSEANVAIEYTSLIGEYNVNGNILILPIRGFGPCNITFVRPFFKYFFDYELEPKNGKQYVKITNTGLTYEAERVYFKLYNLFNGNQQLGETMLTFLDENWKEVNAEIGTRVGDALALVFANILQSMFNRVSYNELFNNVIV